jgi:hypothetical protein
MRRAKSSAATSSEGVLDAGRLGEIMEWRQLKKIKEFTQISRTSQNTKNNQFKVNTNRCRLAGIEPARCRV